MTQGNAIQRSIARPSTCIFGWGMCGFGLLAGIGMSVDTFVFSDEFDTQAKLLLSAASIVGFMLGGILFGGVMWLSFGKRLRDRLANNSVEDIGANRAESSR